MPRPPKRPTVSGGSLSLEDALRSLRPRPAFGGAWEFEAIELGGHAVFLTRFPKPVFDMVKEWEAAYPDLKLALPEAAPDVKILTRFRVLNGEEAFDFWACGAQAYSVAPRESLRSLMRAPHGFIPKELRTSQAYQAIEIRLHLAGGSDQWVGRSKLENLEP
jgi:hypothetical protein